MMLERVAVDRPLVMVVEDIHWAEATLLDLLEYLVAFSSGRAILLVCLAPARALGDPPGVGGTPAEQLTARVEPALGHGGS